MGEVAPDSTPESSAAAPAAADAADGTRPRALFFPLLRAIYGIFCCFIVVSAGAAAVAVVMVG